VVLPPLHHDGRVAQVEFSPDGRQLLAVAGPAVSVWDARTGKPLFGPLGLYPRLRGLLFAAGALGRPLDAYWARVEAVRHAAFSADGARLLTVAADVQAHSDSVNGGYAQLWSAAGEPLTAELDKSSDYSRPLAPHAELSPDGRRLLTCADDTVRLRDAREGK